VIPFFPRFLSSSLAPAVEVDAALVDSKTKRAPRARKSKKEVETLFDEVVPKFEAAHVDSESASLQQVDQVLSPQECKKSMVQEESVSVNLADDSQMDGQMQEGFEETDDFDEFNSQEQLASNQQVVTLSYSLMSQLRQMARMEGVSPEDMIIELIAEGVTKRAFEDSKRPMPSHLMTRTGYVPPEANGNTNVQPHMSHHQMQNGQGNRNNNNNGRRFGNNNNSNSNGHFFGNRQGHNGNGGSGGNGGNRFNGNRNQGHNPNQNRQMNNNRPPKRNFNPQFQQRGPAPQGGKAFGDQDNEE
jgi:hypothetical protein